MGRSGRGLLGAVLLPWLRENNFGHFPSQCSTAAAPSFSDVKEVQTAPLGRLSGSRGAQQPAEEESVLKNYFLAASKISIKLLNIINVIKVLYCVSSL